MDGVTSVSFSNDGLRLISGAKDTTIRLWDVRARKQIDIFEGSASTVQRASESIDGCHIVSQDCVRTYVWNRQSRVLLWKSGNNLRKRENSIPDEEAENIILKCGQETQRFWSDPLPLFISELYLEDLAYVYSNLLDGNLSFGNLPPVTDWKYHSGSKILAAAVNTGAVSICRLITEK